MLSRSMCFATRRGVKLQNPTPSSCWPGRFKSNLASPPLFRCPRRTPARLLPVTGHRAAGSTPAGPARPARSDGNGLSLRCGARAVWWGPVPSWGRALIRVAEAVLGKGKNEGPRVLRHRADPNFRGMTRGVRPGSVVMASGNRLEALPR